MLIQKAIEQVQFNLGNRRDLEEKIINVFTLIQEEVEDSGSPYWYLFQRDVAIPTVAGSRTIEYPERFIQFYDGESLYHLLPDGTRGFLESDVRSLLLAAYPGQGEPAAFFDTNSEIELFPTPDAVYDLRADCYIGQPTVREAIAAMGRNAATNRHFEKAADLFIAMATYRMAQALQNKNVIQSSAADILAARRRLTRKHTVWEENNLTRNMGDSR